MNYRTQKLRFAVTMAFVVLNSSRTFANADDRTTEKTRDAVESAGPDDWYTLAVSAEKCFKKKVNRKENLVSTKRSKPDFPILLFTIHPCGKTAGSSGYH